MLGMLRRRLRIGIGGMMLAILLSAMASDRQTPPGLRKSGMPNSWRDTRRR